ncbi:type IV pilus modification protein PilV [Solemya velesiana gill symbiont]|uniref:Type IV pilus modification protein PilV n=1 Tax=Solemya velesiana gill symbiont TaxID=1918948 RepID=A0A1T2KRY7_9GAMM|nr:type IV pilus modification protein PilV [Solemya velesiana gill symbiont]
MTLIEVLVAVVILAVGLLGLAGLQVHGLRNIAVSANHSQAAIITNELVERIHLNRDNFAGELGLGTDAYLSSECPAYGSLNTADVAVQDLCRLVMKDSDGDAIPDIKEDRIGRFKLLSIGECAVADCPAGGFYTITITWDELAGTGDDREVSYTVDFMP